MSLIKENKRIMKSTNVNAPTHKRLRDYLQMSTKKFKTLFFSLFIPKKEFIGISIKERVEWQNKVVMFYFTTLYLIGICIVLFADVEPHGMFYKYANAAQGVCICAVAALHFMKVINIRITSAGIFSICTLEIIVELFHQAVYEGGSGPLSIMTNMVILASIASISALTYMRRLSLSISAAALIAYNVCAWLMKSKELMEYSYLLLLSFAFITFVGSHLARTFVMLLDENQAYKEDQEQLLDYMQLSKEQWRELLDALRVTGKRIDIDKTNEVMNLLEERLRARLEYKAKEMIKMEHDYTVIIQKRCPPLTDMELKTANYVLKGMTSAEIASTLDTTTSTVTTLRSRIRNKCALLKEESLQSYLERIVSMDE